MNRRPDRAFILAAGFGTRLLPLTRAVPKPLLPLCGRPMLDRALDLVKSWGVKDVVINVHHGADALIRHLTRRKDSGLRVQVSFEPEILGTGGALAKASWFFSDRKPFWMVNADVVADVAEEPMIKAFRPGTTIASAWLMATRGPRTVESRGGYIVDFQSRRPRTEGTYTFCGVHLVDPAILRFLPSAGFASIIDAYQKAMAGGWKVAGVPVENAYWADIGTPDQYVQAEIEYAARSPERVRISPARDSVRIKADTRYIYGPGVAEKTYSGIMAMRACDALDVHEQSLVIDWCSDLGRMVACPLAPRGSARSFSRLYDRDRTAILVRHKPEREENNLYAAHARFLVGLGIPAPRVLAENSALHLALFEDSGATSVQDVAASWPSVRLESLYRNVLETMVVFHEAGYRAARRKKIRLMPPFDRKLFAWEHDLFMKLFLEERAGVSGSTLRAIDRELTRLSRPLLKVRPVLVHRDLQSSNIMLKGAGWSLIDFQGMRFGPAVYDLASLLCDPYIPIDPDARGRLLAHYHARADRESDSLNLFWTGAVQRLGQALGAYARLSKLPGTGHFARYIRPALVQLREALGHLDATPVLSETVAGVINKADP